MRTIIILAVVTVLGGCAHFKREPEAATCDGKHRRPANVGGSVLAPSDATGEIGPAAALNDPSFVRCGS